jgi:type IV secretory pathway TraG/TraD family ATPase VirD4
MKTAYPVAWEAFLSNARVTQVFGAADLATLKYLSERIGKRTGQAQSTNTGRGSSGQMVHISTNANRGSGVQEIQRDVMDIFEISTMKPGEQLLFLPGAPPIRCEKIDYLNDPEFGGRFDSSPSHP